VEAANVTRLMRRHRIVSLDELRRRSVADMAWYGDAVADELGIPFRTPYHRILDTSRGPQWALVLARIRAVLEGAEERSR
jgi:acetyl-CoA synthetase